ncbi:protein O-linked-mannose beta-1,2-N-acetylglucosaminyltransferase 1-like isoform X2 [Cryptotermes secundus]|nr:protein O-linked-mannose beta-1,2-N-acetylglucosaminyltransferase 1-like isoform X2 [Cryptotermes secundus]XP_033606782.1 protein O-linked-mannose beta-1,2-N-acetylglucosaminyltransferase 1-like isoform X2 [Cryptotermes secundus]XP_033606783.1 protein O-linked-mannose beta-1,2-N-acetylglucosaminyltransferase 1-like isoform X2 [Cryptotermes secundus]XP_033606784.1 protein O-linked-mannose beta-1,2-N-acetylglucosaminyltransferase 1-like isoform X2 [Cryptotermes secundus]XP_033606785.1 protein 
MWMRLPEDWKGRQCVIPDMSRTYHFSASGLNMNSYFQDVYFTKHSFNINKNVYEEIIVDMIKRGLVLDHSKSPCENFIPDKKCFKICDLDVRGYHKSTWRLHIKGSEMLVVGVPYSEYSKFKPSNVTPVYLEEKTNVR